SLVGRAVHDSRRQRAEHHRGSKLSVRAEEGSSRFFDSAAPEVRNLAAVGAVAVIEPDVALIHLASERAVHVFRQSAIPVARSPVGRLNSVDSIGKNGSFVVADRSADTIRASTVRVETRIIITPTALEAVDTRHIREIRCPRSGPPPWSEGLGLNEPA